MAKKASGAKVFRNKDYFENQKSEQLKDEVNRLLNNQLVLKHQLRVAQAEADSLKEERNMLQKQMVLDPLTKVKNRKGYDQALEHEVNQLPAAGDLRTATSISLGLLMVDADFFKLVNDRYGHDVGDEALVAIAQVLKSTVRTYDEVCRWGGEEFAVILPGINEFGLRKVGEKIRAAVTDLNFAEIPNLQVSVSIGGSIQLHQNDTQLFFRADAALLDAKEAGRDRVVITDKV